MKTQDGETEFLRTSSFRQGALGQRPLVAGCVRCELSSSFSSNQVAAAQRVWKIGSGRTGVAAVEFLGGDGTTNQCACGMESEIVFTAESEFEVQWRRSRHVERGVPRRALRAKQ